MATVSADSTCCLIDGIPKQTCSKLSVPPILDNSDVNKIVEAKLCNNNFEVSNWLLKPVEETNGFLGQYYNLLVTVKINDKSRSLKFFAKTPPPVESPQYEFLTRFDTFNKEITAYIEMFSRMSKVGGMKWQPECYLGKNNDIIVLEDVTVEGYVISDKHVPFDKQHCVWIVRALSMFHSRSLILDEKLRRSADQTILDLYGHLLTEVLFVENDKRSQGFLSSSIMGMCTLVDLVVGLKDEERIAIKEKLDKWCRKISKLLEPSSKFRNVICHRDIWANNIMFKYDSTGKPNGCYIIDYQFLRYCPPAIDFVLLLYLTTNRAIRDRYFETFAKLYHETMRQQLSMEGLDIEECLPWNEFIQSCRESKSVGIVYAATNSQIMLLSGSAIKQIFGDNPEKLEDVLYGDKRAELVTHQYYNVPSFKARMDEIVFDIKDHLSDQPPNL